MLDAREAAAVWFGRGGWCFCGGLRAVMGDYTQLQTDQNLKFEVWFRLKTYLSHTNTQSKKIIIGAIVKSGAIYTAVGRKRSGDPDKL